MAWQTYTMSRVSQRDTKLSVVRWTFRKTEEQKVLFIITSIHKARRVESCMEYAFFCVTSEQEEKKFSFSHSTEKKRYENSVAKEQWKEVKLKRTTRGICKASEDCGDLKRENYVKMPWEGKTLSLHRKLLTITAKEVLDTKEFTTNNLICKLWVFLFKVSSLLKFAFLQKTWQSCRRFASFKIKFLTFENRQTKRVALKFFKFNHHCFRLRHASGVLDLAIDTESKGYL